MRLKKETAQLNASISVNVHYCSKVWVRFFQVFERLFIIYQK